MHLSIIPPCTLFVAVLVPILCASASAQSVKIVGIGASPCAKFLLEASADPRYGREYMAWAQGYLSGLLIRAPQGKDENLDLAPSSFPLRRQAGYLRTYCETHRSADFSDAVEELYKELRAAPR